MIDFARDLAGRAVEKLRNFGKLEPEPIGPFESYRYPVFFVSVPTGKRAPRRAVISAVDGVAEFVRIYPWATGSEVAEMHYAFEFAFAPAVTVIPAHQ